MKGRLSTVLSYISRNKYLIVTVLGIIIVGFLDNNSLLRRIRYSIEISDLKDEIKKYQSRYDEDSEELKELRNNPSAIKRIARERYFMKTDDEDIFVLSDDQNDSERENETTK